MDARRVEHSAQRAKRQAVISAWGDMPLAERRQATVAKPETTFGSRQITDNGYPSATHGLNAPVDGKVGERGT
jgi:hypothetical protein